MPRLDKEMEHLFPVVLNSAMRLYHSTHPVIAYDQTLTLNVHHSPLQSTSAVNFH